MPFQGPRVSGVKTGKFYAANHNPHNACGFGASSVTESDLIRFVDAQAQAYSQVVEELTDGHKRTHWMWFIFPQLSGLGHSAMAQRYAIRDISQARRYLADPILGDRLRHDVRLIVSNKGKSALEIFGPPDDLKFRSCITLFYPTTSSAATSNAVLVAVWLPKWTSNRRLNEPSSRLGFVMRDDCECA